MSKVKDVIIDADHILFFVAENPIYKTGFEKSDDDLEEYDDFGKKAKVSLKKYKKHFKAIIDEYVKIAEVESICYDWTIGDVKVILTDSRNFRYDLYPEYKANRKNLPKNETLERLRKWAKKTYRFEKNCEADDVVAYYVRKGGIGFTTDKDLLKGVAGKWFNTHNFHRCWVNTSKKDAEHFFKCQVLAGDSVDNIPSLKGVGLKTAEKLLKEQGSNWSDILMIYISKGYTKEYMETMIRLIAMNQWTPKKGIKLFNLNKVLKNEK